MSRRREQYQPDNVSPDYVSFYGGRGKGRRPRKFPVVRFELPDKPPGKDKIDTLKDALRNSSVARAQKKSRGRHRS